MVTNESNDIFFQDKGKPEQTRMAKEVCNTCPVKRECYDYSVATGSRYGTWGGKQKQGKVQ